MSSKDGFLVLQLSVQACRDWHILNRHPTLKCKNIKRVPQVKIHHKTMRDIVSLKGDLYKPSLDICLVE